MEEWRPQSSIFSDMNLHGETNKQQQQENPTNYVYKLEQRSIAKQRSSVHPLESEKNNK